MARTTLARTTLARSTLAHTFGALFPPLFELRVELLLAFFIEGFEVIVIRLHLAVAPTGVVVVLVSVLAEA